MFGWQDRGKSSNPEAIPILLSNDNHNGSLSPQGPTFGEKHLPLAYDFDKFLFGVCYMFCMGVCAIVLVVLGSTLEEIAIQCNTTSKNIGTVFLARGVGAIIGAVVSAKLFEWFHGNRVLGCALLAIAGLLMWIPFNTSILALHICFGFLGLATAITDTGSQIMTTKVHGRVAGPWLGANTVAFGISGAFVPFIEKITPSLLWENSVIAGSIAAVALAILVLSYSRRLMDEMHSAREYYEQFSNKKYNYVIEVLIAMMVFCFVGGKVAATAYLTVYIGDSGVVSVDQESNCMFLLWLAIAVGRLAGTCVWQIVCRLCFDSYILGSVGVYDQIYVTNETIRTHLTVFSLGGFAAVLLILQLQKSSSAFYIGVTLYGLFNGPCVGYCYDLNNRCICLSALHYTCNNHVLTSCCCSEFRLAGHTETSMSIVMLGINFGASLVPYFMAYIWNYDALGLGRATIFKSSM
jgi:predicted MFS family arabinose efflux permease